jgi:hypothetical protein
MALPAGGVVRYSLLAFLAARYGWQMLTTVISRLGQPVRIAIIGVGSGDRGFLFHFLKET